MAGKAKSDGPTSKSVRENHKRIRESRDMTWAQESRFLNKLGWDIPALGLRRIEDGDRRVDVDDLMALAAVLDVSPLELLLSKDDGGGIQVTGVGTVAGEDAHAWARGEKPLLLADSPGSGRLIGHSSNPLGAIVDYGPPQTDVFEKLLSSDQFKNAVREAMRDDD